MPNVRFDPVLNLGSVIQILMLVFSLVVGSVTFYNKQSAQASQLEDINVSIKELGVTVRSLEIDSVRRGDRLERLEDEFKANRER